MIKIQPMNMHRRGEGGAVGRGQMLEERRWDSRSAARGEELGRALEAGLGKRVAEG